MSKIQLLLHCSSVVSVAFEVTRVECMFLYINQTKSKLFIIQKRALKFIWREEKTKITFGFLLPIQFLVNNFLNGVLLSFFFNVHEVLPT